MLRCLYGGSNTDTFSSPRIIRHAAHISTTGCVVFTVAGWRLDTFSVCRSPPFDASVTVKSQSVQSTPRILIFRHSHGGTGLPSRTIARPAIPAAFAWAWLANSKGSNPRGVPLPPNLRGFPIGGDCSEVTGGGGALTIRNYGSCASERERLNRVPVFIPVTQVSAFCLRFDTKPSPELAFALSINGVERRGRPIVIPRIQFEKGSDWVFGKW